LILTGIILAALGGFSSKAPAIQLKPFDNSYEKPRKNYKNRVAVTRPGISLFQVLAGKGFRPVAVGCDLPPVISNNLVNCLVSRRQRRIRQRCHGKLVACKLMNCRPKGGTMANEGYHEPIENLSAETKDMHRAITSLMEELEAVDWYNQRMDATADPELKRILEHNRDEEKEHAAMVLEWIRRRDPKLNDELREVLFTEGDIADHEDGD
jgi:ferritin-like protein